MALPHVFLSQRPPHWQPCSAGCTGLDGQSLPGQLALSSKMLRWAGAPVVSPQALSDHSRAPLWPHVLATACRTHVFPASFQGPAELF